MRSWISLSLVILLFGCSTHITETRVDGGTIVHSPSESVYYSSNTESHQSFTHAQATTSLPELLIGKEYHNYLNYSSIKYVRIRGTRIEISNNGVATFKIPLKDINPDVVKIQQGSEDLFFINLTSTAQITFNSHENNEYKKSVADALYVLKQDALINKNEDDTTFAATARRYREASPKPLLPEEARRLKVQAEAAVQDKKFDEAADLYEEAVHVAPWWPAGHFNYAVMLSETGDHELAIREMKRYLLLVPDAPDAQAAQNSIYKWERKAGAPN